MAAITFLSAMSKLIFWQSIVSPHMLGLADAMVRRGHAVTYAAVSVQGGLRGQMGWPEHVESACTLTGIPTEADAIALATREADDTVNVFQGIRGHPVLGAGLAVVLSRALRLWCILEKIDERGAKGWLRGFLYRRMVRKRSMRDIRYLAIGKGMRGWLIRQGCSADRVYPFAYYLSGIPAGNEFERGHEVRLAYIGQLIARKRVDLILRALKGIQPDAYSLTVIGDGPLRQGLERLAEELGIGSQIVWAGTRPMEEVRALMSSFDRVILPSDHDGWGAVVSEALIAGTPATCSDRCGAAAAIFSPDMGTVFRSGDASQLHDQLRAAVAAGPVPSDVRKGIRELAHDLTAEAGAKYFDALLAAADNGVTCPFPAWYRPSAAADGGQ